MVLNPNPGTDMLLFSLICPVYMWRPWNWLIPRPRISTDCVENQATDEAFKAKQRTVAPSIAEVIVIID
jgi:hypothetical protein